MKKIRYIAASLLTLPLAVWANVLTISWFTDVTGVSQIYYSDGTKVDTSDFIFQIGAFSPEVDTSTLAASNMTSILQSEFISFGTSSWIPDAIDAGVGGAQIDLAFNDVTGFPGGVVSGDQVYVVAYDSHQTNWLVITNSNWILDELNDSSGVSDSYWSITDAGTSYLLGKLVGNQIIANSSAVPEPATWVAIFGVCTLGFALCRRRSISSS